MLNLHYDVVLKVFDFLDGKSLKEASLVCKRFEKRCKEEKRLKKFLHFSWNEIISSSPQSMRKFTLTLSTKSQKDSSWLEKLYEIRNIRKKFQSLRVELKWRSCQKEIQSLNSILCHHGLHLRNLTLSSVCFFNSRDFCDVLRNLPLLTNLELNYIRFELGETLNGEKVFLENLKTIKINNCSWTLMQFLNSPNLKSIEILYGNCSDRSFLMEFMKTLWKLESLIIDGSALNVIFQELIDIKFPFKLKKLNILSKFSYENSTKIDKNFRNFLESQKSLDEFRFGSFS